MAETLKTTFLLRRGKASAWERNNPVLQSGEPGFVTDQNRLKIGDGVTAWIDLPYVNDGVGTGGVFNAETHYDFPSVGTVDMIYKAQAEKRIYQWNNTKLKYEILSEIDLTIEDLEIIHGGNANGST